MAQAMAKLRWPLRNRKTLPMDQATPAEKAEMTTNPTGMMTSSCSLSGVRVKATLEKSSAGVKRVTLTLLSVCERKQRQGGLGAGLGETLPADLLRLVVHDALAREDEANKLRALGQSCVAYRGRTRTQRKNTSRIAFTTTRISAGIGFGSSIASSIVGDRYSNIGLRTYA